MRIFSKIIHPPTCINMLIVFNVGKMASAPQVPPVRVIVG
jgi:hypothetical protein